MGTVTFDHGELIQGRQNTMGTFDADIAPEVRNRRTNADLTLFVRIHFQKIDPISSPATYNDSDGNAVPIRPWGTVEWPRWKRQFLSDCRRKWHGKFWLKTPTTYNGLNWPQSRPTHRCNLYCRFEISEQSGKNGAHAVIPVVHVDGNHSFRSDMLLYSNRDVEREHEPLTSGPQFFTHVHEIGHLIGLDHPGAGRAGCVNGGEAICYASPDGDSFGVMGRGSRIYKRHAQPWVKAAAILTGTRQTDWDVSLTRVRPQPI